MKKNCYILFNYSISCDIPALDFEQKECISINCLNPHSYVEAEKYSTFKNAILDSDYLIPDGDGIVYGIRKAYGIKIKKVAGDDLQRTMLEALNHTGGSCLYFGSGDATLQRIANRLKEEFPNIRAHFISPIHFSNLMPEKENKQYADEIKAMKPDVVFVGLGTRKQEEWISRNKKYLQGSVSYMCGIGAAFDMIADTYPRAPKFFVDNHCEWLYRLAKEPRRMWKRNFISTPIYLHALRRFVKQNSQLRR